MNIYPQTFTPGQLPHDIYPSRIGYLLPPFRTTTPTIPVSWLRIYSAHSPQLAKVQFDSRRKL